AGLAVQFYGVGCAVGDYDNDGHPDLYVTALGPNHLFHNNGDGTFTDVTRRAGVGDPRFSSSAAWLDYDRDGLLDLFVCNYVQWSPEQNVFCSVDGKQRSYCTPEAYRGSTCCVFGSRGGRGIQDVRTEGCV